MELCNDKICTYKQAKLGCHFLGVGNELGKSILPLIGRQTFV